MSRLPLTAHPNDSCKPSACAFLPGVLQQLQQHQGDRVSAKPIKIPNPQTVIQAKQEEGASLAGAAKVRGRSSRLLVLTPAMMGQQLSECKEGVAQPNASAVDGLLGKQFPISP